MRGSRGEFRLWNYPSPPTPPRKIKTSEIHKVKVFEIGLKLDTHPPLPPPPQKKIVNNPHLPPFREKFLDLHM